MKYTQVQADAFKHIQLNAGILVDSFTPASQTIGNIIGVTSGGINFTATPTYTDFGEDIDNCPKNTKELKRLDTWEAKMRGTFAAVDASLAKLLVGAGTVSSGHIIPSSEVATTDFSTIWWVGDYSDVNEDGDDQTAGYVAIKLINALSTTGFQIQSIDKAKGTFSFEFTGHYSMNSTSTVPFEIYIQQGSADTYSINVTSVAGTTTGKTAITTDAELGTGESYVYKTASSVTLPAEGDSVSTGYTAWDGTSEITATTGNEIAIIVKDSSSKAVHAGKTTVVSKS